MIRPRVSIRWLMGLVLAAALGFGALRDGSDLTASALVTGLWLFGGLAVLMAVHGRGRARAFWTGCAGFGLGYALLAFGPGSETSIRARLLPTKALDLLYVRLHSEPNAVVQVWSTPSTSFIQPGTVSSSPVQSAVFTSSGSLVLSMNGPGLLRLGPPRDTFQDVGHALTGWLAAVLGGLASRRLWTRGDCERAAIAVAQPDSAD